MRPLRAFHSAVAMYTWLPVTKHDWDDQDFPDGLLAFPWLGALLGGAIGSLGWGIVWASGTPWLGAVVALAAIAWATGAMHLDGLADVADGLGSRKPPEQAQAIMKRSDIGPMGVVALLLVLLAEIGAIVTLPASAWPLLLAVGLAAGRVTPLAAARPRVGAQPSPGTLSALVAGRVQPRHLWVTRAVVLIAVVVASGVIMGWPVGLGWGGAMVLAWGIAAGWQRHLMRRLGRLNGDCYGSLIEITQLSVWLLIACTARWIGVL